MNPFLVLAQQTDGDLQEVIEATRRRAQRRAPDEVLREAREKHTKYKSYVARGSLKTGNKPIGMSRLQFGDGEYTRSVQEHQRLQATTPRPEPLPEIEEQVQLTSTLSRSRSNVPGYLRSSSSNTILLAQQQEPSQQQATTQQGAPSGGGRLVSSVAAADKWQHADAKEEQEGIVRSGSGRVIFPAPHDGYTMDENVSGERNTWRASLPVGSSMHGLMFKSASSRFPQSIVAAGAAAAGGGGGPVVGGAAGSSPASGTFRNPSPRPQQCDNAGHDHHVEAFAVPYGTSRRSRTSSMLAAPELAQSLGEIQGRRSGGGSVVETVLARHQASGGDGVRQDSSGGEAVAPSGTYADGGSGGGSGSFRRASSMTTAAAAVISAASQRHLEPIPPTTGAAGGAGAAGAANDAISVRHMLSGRWSKDVAPGGAGTERADLLLQCLRDDPSPVEGPTGRFSGIRRYSRTTGDGIFGASELQLPGIGSPGSGGGGSPSSGPSHVALGTRSRSLRGPLNSQVNWADVATLASREASYAVTSPTAVRPVVTCHEEEGVHAAAPDQDMSSPSVSNSGDMPMLQERSSVPSVLTPSSPGAAAAAAATASGSCQQTNRQQQEASGRRTRHTAPGGSSYSDLNNAALIQQAMVAELTKSISAGVSNGNVGSSDEECYDEGEHGGHRKGGAAAGIRLPALALLAKGVAGFPAGLLGGGVAAVKGIKPGKYFAVQSKEKGWKK